MKKIPHILKAYHSLSLEELKAAHLMNRVDTKFIVAASKLPQIINELIDQYSILEINGHRITLYQNLYFDTNQHAFYLDHHNKKEHRYKVRFRRYENTDTTFLEVKQKHKKRTTKERITVGNLQSNLNEKEQFFIEENMDKMKDIKPCLLVEYNRITLINPTLEERFTLDLEVQFTTTHSKNINHVVIAELKQKKLNKRSPVYQLMNKIKARPHSFSKYCIGLVLLSEKRTIKYNNFKEILLHLDKLKTSEL